MLRQPAVIIRPFVDSYNYNPSNELAADETYIKISGVKAYVRLIMDKVSRSILGYQVSLPELQVPVSSPCAWPLINSKSSVRLCSS